MVFTALYASEGAPIGYIWWALPTKLRASGASVEEVTALTALLTLPWALKFLWAPLVDTLRGARWGLRSWIVATQLGMGLALIPLLVSTGISTSNLRLLTVLLVGHALMASTQDVSIDALAIASVPEDERGSINGFMQLGMLGARAAFGGFALYLESFVGERVILGALVFTVWSSMLIVLLAVREPPRDAASGGFLRRLVAMMRQPTTWFGLAFAVVAGAGFKATGAVAGPMLLDGGLSQSNVGVFFSITAAALAIGALGGGRLADRFGRHAAVRGLLLAVAALVATVAAATLVGGWPLAGALVVLYCVAGALTAAEFALYMDLTDPALGATQFSAFMGAINLCEVWSSFGVGRLVPTFGYGLALLALAAVSLLGLPIATRLRLSTYAN